jgi:hypothetical protein
MAYLAEWYRRQTYASQKLAAAAHQKELMEAQVGGHLQPLNS